jgi:hypothetical protein
MSCKRKLRRYPVLTSLYCNKLPFQWTPTCEEPATHWSFTEVPFTHIHKPWSTRRTPRRVRLTSWLPAILAAHQRSEVFTAVTMKNPVFWDIKTQLVPHRKHIMSLLQSPAGLTLYKIWGFHGGYYEEYHLLGYKTPARTSQETHYVSATESSQ